MVVRRQRTRAVGETAAPTSRVVRRLSRSQPGETPARKATHMIARLRSEFPLGAVLEAAGATMQAPRPGHYLHVSDLLSKCVRKRALLHKYNIRAKARRLSLSDELTFAQGDAIHDLLKDRARRGAPQQVWGKWSCRCESLMHEEPCTFAEIDQEEECPHCGSTVTKYHEVSMFDEEYWIVGNPDLILYQPESAAFHITELKSIAESQFKELARPKPEHVLQVVFYWYLMRKLGYKLTDKVSILYASKGWMFGNAKPYIEFVIDPEKELHRLDDMLEDARGHREAVETGKLPPRIVCSTRQTKDAKDCEVCNLCFEAA